MRSLKTRAISLLSACCLGPVTARADGPVKFSAADLDLGRETIVVAADSKKDFTAALSELSKIENWRIALKGADIPVVKVTLDLRDAGVHLFFKPGSFTVFDAADIPNGDLAVTYAGAGTVTVATGKKAHVAAGGGFRDTCFKWVLTKDKKKADVDISGGLQAGVGAKPQYNWSVKASCPFYAFQYGEIGPSFTGEASQQANADPDSLKAGITWRKLIAPEGTRNGWILSADALSYEFERKLKKEPVIMDGKPVDRQFLEKNTNLMWSGKAAYVSGWPSLNWTLTFAGFEAGKALTRTIKSDSRSANQQTVARLYFSFDAYRTFFHNDRPIITFHGNQILRLPFHQEPFMQADVNGGTMFLTSKPRHWSLVEMTFPLTDGAGIDVQYKRGSLPPTFEFVDHQVTIGFNLLLKHGG